MLPRWHLCFQDAQHNYLILTHGVLTGTPRNRFETKHTICMKGCPILLSFLQVCTPGHAESQSQHYSSLSLLITLVPLSICSLEWSFLTRTDHLLLHLRRTVCGTKMRHRHTHLGTNTSQPMIIQNGPDMTRPDNQVIKGTITRTDMMGRRMNGLRAISGYPTSRNHQHPPVCTPTPCSSVLLRLPYPYPCHLIC
jgi:hypothetical protein